MLDLGAGRAELPFLVFGLLASLPPNHHRQHLLVHVDPGHRTIY